MQYDCSLKKTAQGFGLGLSNGLGSVLVRSIDPSVICQCDDTSSSDRECFQPMAGDILLQVNDESVTSLDAALGKLKLLQLESICKFKFFTNRFTAQPVPLDDAAYKSGATIVAVPATQSAYGSQSQYYVATTSSISSSSGGGGGGGGVAPVHATPLNAPWSNGKYHPGEDNEIGICRRCGSQFRRPPDSNDAIPQYWQCAQCNDEFSFSLCSIQ